MLSGVATPAGLRERKKEKTKNALVDAAVRLFVEQGYEHTTVREITDVVGISERTFFRYFVGKDELVLFVVTQATDMFLAELIAAPTGQPPLPTLRDAFCRALCRLPEVWPGMDGGGHYAAIVRLIQSTPSLLHAQLAMMQRADERFVRALAERYGVDPRNDPRPRVLVVTFGGLIGMATEQWRGEGEVTDLIELIHRQVDAVIPALTGWT